MRGKISFNYSPNDCVVTGIIECSIKGDDFQIADTLDDLIGDICQLRDAHVEKFYIETEEASIEDDRIADEAKTKAKKVNHKHLMVIK